MLVFLDVPSQRGGGFRGSSQAFRPRRRPSEDRRTASAARVTVQKFRGNVSMLLGAGGNIAVLTGSGGKLSIDAATDRLLFGSEEALDDLWQHRLDGERVVGGVRHDCELVCGPQ